MNKLDSMKALAEKVEAGDDDAVVKVIVGHFWICDDVKVGLDIYYAYHGSLDAAKALHEAVLPGWVFWDKSHTYFGYEVALTNGTLDANGCSKVSEARAWLLAIIKAIIAQEDLQDLADADRDLL